MNKNSLKPEGLFPFFKKGIILEDYMKESKDMFGNDSEDDSSEEDLYASVRGKENVDYPKMVTFEINEIDEDNYESSQAGNQSREIKRWTRIDRSEREGVEQQGNMSCLNPLNQERVQDFGGKCIENRTIKVQFNDTKTFRIKNQSNSPKKMPPSPKKQMFHSLYGNSFASSFGKPAEASILSSTIHNKFFKLSPTKQTNKKEAEFKQKNKKHYNQVMKYESVVRNKYHSQFDILNIRVDGVKDRLCQRKPFQK